jgi:hypothetical protein
LDESVDITCLVESAFDSPGTTAEIILPEGATSEGGNLIWNGDLKANVPVSFSAPVVFKAAGNRTIKAVVKRVIDENTIWGDVDYIHLYAAAGESSIGFLRHEKAHREEIQLKDASTFQPIGIGQPDPLNEGRGKPPLQGIDDYSFTVSPTSTGRLLKEPTAATVPTAPVSRPKTGQAAESGESPFAKKENGVQNLAASTMMNEDFEGLFPEGNGWTLDYGTNGYTWDDDDYKPHSGSRSGWCADGSYAGNPDLDPQFDNYPNDMNAWMIYGPFDLSDATDARVVFEYWLDSETGYDYFNWFASTDGVNFYGYQTSGYSAGWVNEIFDLASVPTLGDLSGESQVWIAFVFSSDYIVNYTGAFVDDISIEKTTTVPGEITVSGYFYYYDRNDGFVPAKYVPVELWDEDISSADDYLGGGTTSSTGYFEIGPVSNDDEEWGTQDIYADFVLATTKRRVETLTDAVYVWYTPTYDDVPNGAFDLGTTNVMNGSANEGAMWIFQTMRDAFEYLAAYDDPGSVTVEWANDSTEGTYYVRGEDVHLVAADKGFPDVIVHEMAHNYMWNIYGDWMPVTYCPDPHYINAVSHVNCAWTEGWAYLLPLVVNDDPIFHADGWSVNLENPTGPWDDGDAVEGRVAGALWDIFDTVNDGYDQYSDGFTEIWDTIYNQNDNNFLEYWAAWRSRGHNDHDAVKSVYQNTIDYDSAPTIAGLPDRTLIENGSWDNAIDLWLYSSDLESSDLELDYAIVNVSNPNCGVSIDVADYIDISPVPDWQGSCDVTVEVSDGIKGDSDVFTIAVQECILNSDCEDGLFCSGVDTCSAGTCVHAGDPCPGPDADADCAESCDEVADSCTAADPNGSACDDSLFCNGADTCDGGVCGSHAGDPCPGPDSDADCAESCDEVADSCTAADPNGSACDDADVCTTSDTCFGGSCEAGFPLDCDDEDICTADSCDEILGCANDPIPGCGAIEVPTMVVWGRLLLGLLVLAAGAVLLGEHRHARG